MAKKDDGEWLLGSGMAKKAAKLLKGRQKQLQEEEGRMMSGTQKEDEKKKKNK